MGELAEFLAHNDPNFRKARIPALYSDFRAQRTLNPDGYRANIAAWQDALSLLARNGLLSRTGSSSGPFTIEMTDSLLRSLEDKQFGQPLALGLAVREAILSKALMTVEDFRKAPSSVLHGSWTDISWSIASWTLRSLGISDPARGADKLPKGEFVSIPNLSIAARKLKEQTAKLETRYDRTFSKNQFFRDFGKTLGNDQILKDTDQDVLLRFLSRDRSLIAYDGQVIRILDAADRGFEEVTTLDITTASLKDLQQSLSRQIDLIEERILELNQNAKTALVRKNRVTAMAALKSKKLAESSLATKYASLYQVQDVSSKIQQASDSVQLMKVMESSATVLADLNKQAGGAERADKVMSTLDEEIDATNEVAAILAGSSSNVVLDEAELEQELESMAQQQEGRKEDKQGTSDATKETRHEDEDEDVEAVRLKLDALPDVPESGKETTPSRETAIGSLAIT